MNNEISDHVKLLAEKAKKLNGDVLAVEGTINEPLGAFVDDYLFYSKDIQDYIASLETELAALKAELAQYEWQSGEPKAEGEYWVIVQNLEGEKVNSMDYWHGANWRYYGWRDDETGEPRSDVLAWSEIRPWKGE